MSKVIGLGQFESEMNQLLEDYGDEVNKALKKVVPKVAKETANQTNTNAVSAGIKGKKYVRSWTTTVENNTLTGVEATVHSTQYRVAHLLEFGHAKQNGGRTRAFPHIAKAEEWGIEKLVSEIKGELE